MKLLRTVSYGVYVQSVVCCSIQTKYTATNMNKTRLFIQFDTAITFSREFTVQIQSISRIFTLITARETHKGPIVELRTLRYVGLVQTHPARTSKSRSRLSSLLARALPSLARSKHTFNLSVVGFYGPFV